MARRFLDDIRTDINTQIVTGGELTALELNSIMLDMIDSTIQDEGAIIGTTPVTVALTNTFEQLNVFDANVGGDGLFVIPDFNTGITTGAVAGFSYQLRAQLSFVTDNNRDYEYVITENGIPIGFIASQTGTGRGDTQTMQLSTLVISAPADAVYAIAARNEGATGGLDVVQTSLVCTVVPTNNAA